MPSRSFGAMNLANNTTDWLLLRDNVGALVDSVSWGVVPTAVPHAPSARW